MTKITGKKSASRKTLKNGKNKGRPARVTVTECIGYIRVSTGEQADSGLGLDAQKAKIRAQCEANGWRLVQIYEDAGLSGSTLDRPGLRAALRELKPGRALLAAKLDRFTRSVRDLYDLQAIIADSGGEWASVMDKFDTSTATGRLMLGIMIQMAQWEREVIAERTSAALEEKKTRREHLGAPPLGYRVLKGADGQKTVVKDFDGLEAVAMARRLNGEGRSLREIARALTEAGHQTKRGGKWSAETVRLLLQPRYYEEIEGEALADAAA